MRFCPTGGIDAKNAAAYLATPNVIAVGGSWVAPKEAIAAGDFARVTALARDAAALRKVVGGPLLNSGFEPAQDAGNPPRMTPARR